MKNKILLFLCTGLIIFVTLIASLYFFSFRLNGSNHVIVNYGDDYYDFGYKANIFLLSLNKYVKLESNIDTKKIGKYKVTYKLPFKLLVREVEVVDNLAPQITLNGEAFVNHSVGLDYFDEGVSISDNVDSNLESNLKIETNLDVKKVGTYQIKYMVDDLTGNRSEIIREINVIDDIKPEIKLNGSSIITLKLNQEYEDEGFIAIDNYDGDITDKVKVINNVDLTKKGTYEIIYSCSDESNNYQETKRIVKVTDEVNITYIKGILLVNKKYHLPENYNPGTDSVAYEALLRLQNDASNNGYYLPLLSGFRSYYTQEYLFNSYVLQDGLEKANTYSARPGESEHQTGLAFDVGNIDYGFGETESGKWLSNNAHKYGFIIRYLKGKEDITGYIYEPWHIRYVGDIAEEIYNLKITLEEYLGVN